MNQAIELHIVLWLTGGLITIIGGLVGIIWTAFSSEIKRGAIYRHHIAPKKFAEIDTTLLKQEARIDSHAVRLTQLEG
jgi:hypothetical protein